ncbi:MAG: hypothetical protein WEE89_19925 [Gemmatimonadota bacterium]
MLKRIGSTGVLLLLMAAPATAQEKTQNPEPTVLQRLDVPKPTSLETVPQVRHDAPAPAAATDEAKPLPLVTRGQSVAMMIAGGALFVAGAIVGDDAGTLLMVGGAGIGAFGLYLHFR